MQFRSELVAFTADIKQMFHSFVVREDHRNFLRFLRFKDNDNGNRPSPAIAIYGLRQAAIHGDDEFGEDAR